jgi:two-component system, response regulator PdtaR
MQNSRNGRGPLIVLVVEDEFLLRLEIVEYLQNAGCVVLEAWSANEAVAVCRNGEPVDILVTDINLRGPGTGWEVAEALRALQPGAGVIYVSGNSLDHSRRVVGSLFFKKPYSASEILEACRGLA